MSLIGKKMVHFYYKNGSNSQKNKLKINPINLLFKLTLMLVLAGCGGGSSEGSSKGSITASEINILPTANAGNHQTVLANQEVILVGNGVDTDGEITSFRWEQISGETVNLKNSNSATASFAAPIVNEATPLLFMLTVTDDSDGSNTGLVTITILGGELDGETSTISGQVTFDSINHNPNQHGLDYENISIKPVRNVVVQVVDASDRSTIVATAKTTATGYYSFALQGSKEIFIRVRAELRNSSGSRYDISVVNNFEKYALYVLDAEDIFISPERAIQLNVHASSGWSGTKYNAERAAAPFAILDAIYDCVKLLESADSNVKLPKLKVNWCPENKASEEMKAEIGEIVTSHFSSTNDIYLLGNADVDTDEFDKSIIMHEFAHYVEASISRSDSIGGMHSVTEKLDMRVAFGEGFANAFACIASNNPEYRDSFGLEQSTGSYKNLDDNNFSSTGWYNEGSVGSILYDLFDTENEDNDSISLPFKNIYDVLSKDHVQNDGVNSIFSFLFYLKIRNPEISESISLLASAQDIEASNLDEFASFETNDGGGAHALPLYTDLKIDESPLIIGTSVEFGSTNKLSNYRYLILNITESGEYKITANAEKPENDPDFKIFLKGEVIKSAARPGSKEELSIQLNVGVYCLVLRNYIDVEDPGRAGVSSLFTIGVEKL
ncbi:MAG: hypothetical protein COA79_09365 [Planctomycetota bacterium]|nr:MAG: hypothetical protein COA79_09365 [Planctomycetota bacterium]